MRKVAAPTPSPSSPAVCRASSQCSADVLATAYSGTPPPLLVTAMVGGYGRAVESLLQRMTLQELRDELDRTRPAWEELANLDDVLKDGQLPALAEDARRHQLVQNELLRRPSEG